MGNTTIQYRFTLEDKSLEVFNIELDSKSLESTLLPPKQLPSWTRLDFHKCTHCPLSSRTHRHCPLAARLVKVVSRFDGLLSYDRAHLEVITEERHVSSETSVQRGIGSLIGLVIATSGCPHTAFFKPMARFHMPFAGREETIYRATSMYLLAQYFLKKQRRKADFSLKGLQLIYRNMQIVNAAVIERLRSVTESDSMVNAVVVLDIYAKTVDMMIERSLQNVRELFTPFFEMGRNRRAVRDS
jgi:Domain of unknown function (DUF6901)